MHVLISWAGPSLGRGPYLVLWVPEAHTPTVPSCVKVLIFFKESESVDLIKGYLTIIVWSYLTENSSLIIFAYMHCRYNTALTDVSSAFLRSTLHFVPITLLPRAQKNAYCKLSSATVSALCTPWWAPRIWSGWEIFFLPASPTLSPCLVREIWILGLL